MALLRHSLRQNTAEPLEAEGLTLTLVQRAIGPCSEQCAQKLREAHAAADKGLNNARYGRALDSTALTTPAR